jgi:arsenate reductase
MERKKMTKRRPDAHAGDLYPELLQYLSGQISAFDTIPSDRQSDLAIVADYIRERLSRSEPAKLTFICTHNSRRSHLAQIWAQVAAQYYGLVGVETFSGGTEATVLNPRAVAAMQRGGLRITAENPQASNPVYRVSMSDTSKPQLCFSKVYHAPPNPTHTYCAVMTCSQADEACPLVLGGDLRIAIRYDDPKEADDTECETQRYDERSSQICKEMLDLMSRV